MFRDTGGYSRTNIFKVSESIYLLQDMNDLYELNVVQRRLRKVEYGELIPREKVFVGVFDVDDSKVWRFIPAKERESRWE